MSKKKRRRFTGIEKIKILKRHLVEGEPISDVCEAEGISPSIFYQWQKKLFEGGAEVFDSKRERSSSLASRDAKIQELEQRITEKNEVISEAVEALVIAKKQAGDR